VEVAFDIGIDRYRVAFREVPEGAQGSLIHDGPGAPRTLAFFNGDEQFEQVMDNLMTERFALPPIQNLSGEDTNSGTPHEATHRWPAYARSLFIEGSHPAILGDIAVGGIWWRMLQLFVGLPYADTLMAIRHALAFDKAGRESGRRSVFANDDVVRLQDALKDEERKLNEIGGEAVDLRELDELGLANAKLVKEIAGIQTRQATAERTAEQVKAEWDQARAELRRLKEGVSAHKIFSGLKPICCPRCSSPFPEERVAHEEDHGRCSVCDRAGLVDDPEGYNERLVAAEEREAALKALHEAASQEAVNLDTKIEKKEGERKVITDRLSYFASQADALAARRRQENVIERLKGALDEVRRSVTSTEEKAPSDRADILRSAEKVAEARMQENSAGPLRALEQEIAEVGARIGFRGLEKVVIRGNGILLTVSGRQSSFSVQTPGQRLRLRIALVIAMMRLAEKTGIGHHPGVLFIDSPGSEEVGDDDLQAMLKEISVLTTGKGRLQVFLATARGEVAKPAFISSNIRTPSEAGTMF
jgi:hypothetical protein